MPINITVTELEEAINYWRVLRPSSGEERALSPEVNALATTYALMIFNSVQSMPFEALDHAAQQLLEVWRGYVAAASAESVGLPGHRNQAARCRA